MATTTQPVFSTPLKDWHIANGGRMVEFAGWLMPVQYTSIIDEHQATRNSVGIFDVSHMGRFFFSGSGIDEFLDGLTTRRISGIERGKIRYSLMTNERGFILDDILIYHLPRPNGESQLMMVVNAGNRLKIKSWIESKISNRSIKLDDRTQATAMIAVQGPKGCEIVAKLGDLNPSELKYYTGGYGKICGKDAIISRTGYTGEDGCEVIVDAEVAEAVATAIAKEASKVDGCPVGLGARDTLRLEAAMPLYGHELSESINAAQTELGFAINLKDREFIGREAIIAAKKSNLPIRVGIELEGRRAAREDCQILVDGVKIGFVTSGTFSPTLQKAISMAYVQPEYASVGNKIEVDIRGKTATAEIVKMPFYTRD